MHLSFVLKTERKGTKVALITSACNFWFWALRESLSAFTASNCFLRTSYSFSSCLVFHLALLFWNHIAICLGWSPKALASCIFLSGSSLFPNSKLFSSAFTCSKLSLFFFSPSWDPSSDNSSSPCTSSHLFSMPENDIDRFIMKPAPAPPPQHHTESTPTYPIKKYTLPLPKNKNFFLYQMTQIIF